MTAEDEDPVDVLHPLLGVDSPTILSLLERADARAQHVLESALRLYALRQAEQAALVKAVEQQTAEQWPAPSPALTQVPVGLREPDLLRALLAVMPTTMAAPLGNDLLRGPFDQAVARCRQQLQRAGTSIDDDTLDGLVDRDELDPGWARRWALADERHGYPRITVEYLVAALGALGVEPLGPFSEMYSEGLITSREAAWRYFKLAADEIRDRCFTPVPAAYLDRGGLLAVLDQAFAESGRVLLVGEPRSGRSALLRAWWDGSDDQSERRLDPHVVGVSHDLEVFDRPVRVGLTAPRLSPARIQEFEWTGYLVDQLQIRQHRDQWLTMHAEYLADEGCEAIVVIDPSDRAKLRRSVPALAEFREVHVPTPTLHERAMIWLAHTMADPRRGPAQVLAAMRHLADHFEHIDPWAVEQCVESSFLRSFLDRDAVLRSLEYRPLRRLLDRHARGESIPEGRWRRTPLGRMRDKSPVEALEQLLELHRRLHGP